MNYPVTLTAAEEGGFVVTFPDVPEAITQGDTREEAMENGLDALITSLDFYFEDQRVIPVPSSIRSDTDSVKLPEDISLWVLSHNISIPEITASQVTSETASFGEVEFDRPDFPIPINEANPANPDGGIFRGQRSEPGKLDETQDDLLRNPSGASERTMNDRSDNAL